MHNNNYHKLEKGGFWCPIHKDYTNHVWSQQYEHDSCPHCTGEDFHIGDKLHELNEQREGADIVIFECPPQRCGPDDHVWDGDWYYGDDGCSSATCSKCGMLAISFSMRYGP